MAPAFTFTKRLPRPVNSVGVSVSARNVVAPPPPPPPARATPPGVLPSPTLSSFVSGSTISVPSLGTSPVAGPLNVCPLINIVLGII